MNLEQLNEMLERMRNYKDPLEEKGIPKDYVCVIHPAIDQYLRQLHQENTQNAGMLVWINWHRQYTGRKTFIEHRAPMDTVEYMEESTYYTKYPRILIDYDDDEVQE